MAWTIENTNGKQWRIVSPDGQWSMQPEGEITADQARQICELVTRSAAQAAGEAMLITLADRLRTAQRAYMADKTQINDIAVGLAAVEYDQGREGQRPLDRPDPVRQAAIDLVKALCDCQSFEVEAGASGEGPLVEMIRALGIDTPPNLAAWLADGSDDNGPCDRCGEHHPAGAMEDGVCPACADDGDEGEA